MDARLRHLAAEWVAMEDDAAECGPGVIANSGRDCAAMLLEILDEQPKSTARQPHPLTQIGRRTTTEQ